MFIHCIATFVPVKIRTGYAFIIIDFPCLFLFRIGVSVKQQFTEEEIYKDRDSQICAIEKTFEDAQKPVSSLIPVAPIIIPH